jgi:hypothetical protein
MALSLLATERPITTTTAVNVDAKSKTADGEIERLQGIVDNLRVEIGMSPFPLRTSKTEIK